VKVLVLHQHFKTPYKGGAIRSYYLATALVSKGIETIVITAHNDKYYKFEKVDGIEVHYLPIQYENRFGFLKRILAFIRFMNASVRLAGRFKNIDLCYAISVPLTIGIAARRIYSHYKIPFIFEVGDLWPEAPVQLGYIKNPVLTKMLYNLERKIYASAKSIVALSPSIQAALKLKTSEKVIHLVPNMSDTDFYRCETKDVALVNKFGVNDKLVVSYIGAVGYANGLDQMIACARACSEMKLPIHFLLCGDGAELDFIRSEVTKNQLKNFSIIPFQNRAGVKKVINITDAVFISYRSVPVLETGSPNKYFDGLAACKLIVINFGGWIKDEIETAKCGIYVDPFNPMDFVERIKPFIADKLLLKKYQDAARKLAETKYSRKILSEKFSKIILESVKAL
jgi:glycosyltransferase involved in cell wall biosynthesis